MMKKNRNFKSVSAHVRFEVVFFSKALAAINNIAHKWTFMLVNAHMQYELTLVTKAAGALIACIFLERICRRGNRGINVWIRYLVNCAGMLVVVHVLI